MKSILNSSIFNANCLVPLMWRMTIFTIAISTTIFNQVQAENVNRSYQGVFSNIFKLGGTTDAASLFLSGDTFTINLTYDTEALRTFSNSTDAFYDGAGTLNVQYSNGYDAGLTGRRISVKNNGLIGSNWTWDSFSMSDSPSYGANIGAASLVAINFRLNETLTGTALSSTDLVPVPYFSLFTNMRRIELVFQQPGITNYVRGTIIEEVVIDPTPTFSCEGFQAPVHDKVVKVKKNRTIPFKAQLFDDTDQAIDNFFVVSSPIVQVLFDDGITSAVDVTVDALAVGAGTVGNQFEFVDGAWQYNLKTSGYSAIGTYTVSMQSGDNSEYIVSPICVGQFVIE